MLEDQVLRLFEDYEEEVKQLITKVLALEQEHISMERPRGVKEQIKKIIERMVKDET